MDCKKNGGNNLKFTESLSGREVEGQPIIYAVMSFTSQPSMSGV